MIDQIQRWSSLAGLTSTVADHGPPFRLRLTLEDIQPPMVVEVVGPAGGDDPYRFNSGFELAEASASNLPEGRLAEIVEAAVLGRSALADARPRADRRGVEMIAVIYADGLSRHTFMTAIYECQKLRQIITRDVESALVSESALASLLTLAETTEDLATSAAPVAPGIPGGPVPGPGPATPEPATTSPPSAPTAPSTPAPPASPPSEQAPPTLVDPLAAPAPSPATPPAPTWDPPPLPVVPPPVPPEGPTRPPG